MSEIQHVHPPSRYIPAREEWLQGWRWCGPVEYLCRPGDTHEYDSLDGWEATAIDGAWMWHPDRGTRFRNEDISRVRLDPRRPEVRDMLARALGLPESHRVWEWAVALCWWAGMTGRPIASVAHMFRGASRMTLGSHGDATVYWTGSEADRDYFVAPTRLGPDVRATPDHVGWLYTPKIGLSFYGMEVGAEADAKINDCALAHNCALVTDGGLLLPPLAPGGAPIIWSDE